MLNKKNLDILRLPTGIRGAPVCIVDTGFDQRTVPDIIEVGEPRVDLHGTCVAWIIRELANPTELHCFARGWTRLDEAVRYCVENDIHLINCSLKDARLSEESIQLCKQHNVHILKSAGNEGDNGVTKPAEIDSVVMAVAGFNALRMAIEGSSSKGPEVDVAAPTDWDIRLWNGNTVPFNGTSASASVITAVLSLYLAARQRVTTSEMKEFIYSNSQDIDQPGRDNTSGHGLFVWPESLEVEPVNWQYIMLHHSGDSLTFEQVRKVHKDKGWQDVGYHYGVEPDGTVKEGRPFTMPGAHEEKFNRTAIGIVALGNFEKHEMPAAQKEGIIKLTKRLMDEHRIPAENLLLHREKDATACPGKHFPADEIRAALTQPYPDVPAGHWAAPAVAWAKEHGLLMGHADGMFRGDEPVTRYQMAAILKRLKG